jgi:hypothetical protein
MLMCIRHALAVAIGVTWLILCVLVLTEPRPGSQNQSQQHRPQQNNSPEHPEQNRQGVGAALRSHHTTTTSDETHIPEESRKHKEGRIVVDEHVLGLSPSVWMLFLTATLIGVAVVQVCIYSQMHRTTREVERAYVTISHFAPFNEGGALDFREPGAVWCAIEIKNEGRTPADILGGVISVELIEEGSLSPSAVPSGSYVKIPPAFLVPNGFLRFRTLVFGFTDEQAARANMEPRLAEDPPSKMWLAGFVIYRDRFKVEHCGGYGRRWDRNTRDLVFDATTAALNYDRAPTEEQKRTGQP